MPWNVEINGELYELIENEAELIINTDDEDNYVKLISYDEDTNLAWVQKSMSNNKIRISVDEITAVTNEGNADKKKSSNISYLNDKFKQIQDRFSKGNIKPSEEKNNLPLPVPQHPTLSKTDDEQENSSGAIKQVSIEGKLKPDFTLLPQMALEDVAMVMTKGEQKYADFNYSKGLELRAYLAAAIRHINKSLRGVDIDEEMQQDHLACAAANILMALDNKLNGKIIDNRNPHYGNKN